MLLNDVFLQKYQVTIPLLTFYTAAKSTLKLWLGCQ